MQEYDIYLPTRHSDGTSVPVKEIEKMKAKLTDAFGGLTHRKQRSDGLWRAEGATFREEVYRARSRRWLGRLRYESLLRRACERL